MCACHDVQLSTTAATHLQVAPLDTLCLSLDENGEVVDETPLSTATASQQLLLTAAALLPLRHLQRVVVECNSHPISIAPIASLARLRMLDLRACRHHSFDLRHFSALRSLTALALSGAVCHGQAFNLPPAWGVADCDFAPAQVAGGQNKEAFSYSSGDIAALAALPSLRSLEVPLQGAQQTTAPHTPPPCCVALASPLETIAQPRTPPWLLAHAGTSARFLSALATLTSLERLVLVPAATGAAAGCGEATPAGVEALARLSCLTHLHTPWFGPRYEWSADEGGGLDHGVVQSFAAAFARALCALPRLRTLRVVFVRMPVTRAMVAALKEARALKALQLSLHEVLGLAAPAQYAVTADDAAAALGHVPRVLLEFGFKATHYPLAAVMSLPGIAGIVGGARHCRRYSGHGDPCCCDPCFVQSLQAAV